MEDTPFRGPRSCARSLPIAYPPTAQAPSPGGCPVPCEPGPMQLGPRTGWEVGARSRAVPEHADFFFCLGTTLQFRGQLQPTAVGWWPTTVGCSASPISVGALLDPQTTRAGGFYFYSS